MKTKKEIISAIEERIAFWQKWFDHWNDCIQKVGPSNTYSKELSKCRHHLLELSDIKSFIEGKDDGNLSKYYPG